jgi:hypothetical protein
VSDQLFSELSNHPLRTEDRISSETRSFMRGMLDLNFDLYSTSENEEASISLGENALSNFGSIAEISPPSTNSTSATPSHTAIITSLVTLILEELENSLPRLLTLNPSRREAIVQHLEKILGNPCRPSDSQNTLKMWIEGPRSPNQIEALRTYFEEIAIITLGQAFLIKHWSDAGIRRWSESDLGRLNWVLSTTLKPFIPLDREGWQITRPNLYSWYNPSSPLQTHIWSTIQAWNTQTDCPHLLLVLFYQARKISQGEYEAIGYDLRFSEALWSLVQHIRFDPTPQNGPLKRPRMIFTPTLRQGSLVRTGSSSIQWIGLEASAFQLMIAELIYLWPQPTTPPLWGIGTGLEVHAKDQLTFSLCSPKPSVLNRIAEMEACDGAFVLEEQSVRTQGKNPNSTRFRELVEQLPYFKKLKQASTSLGALQTCVALHKLRPGGFLLWARDEALSHKEGHEVVKFLLERALLVHEWDFSELEHTLPLNTPLYPKHLYLFQRESNVEVRLSHRPIRHTLQGQMRSHVELPLVLEDAFSAIITPPQPRGQWTVLSHSSPTSQREWIEKWPDPTSHDQIQELEKLRHSSIPLAQFTTIRPTPEGDPNRGGAWLIPFSEQECKKSFCITAEYQTDLRKVVTHAFTRPHQESNRNGFLVRVAEESWVTPLCTYLESQWVNRWLDHHAERRGERWVLNEQIVKWIPVPQTLLTVLGMGQRAEEASLPNDWVEPMSQLAYQPQLMAEILKNHASLNTSQATTQDLAQAAALHATIFVQTARTLEQLCAGQQRLLSMVTDQGRIRWRELMTVLPKSEQVNVLIHPRIRITGSIPPHLPIEKIEALKNPRSGVQLSTESGFMLQIICELPLLTQILLDQLEGIAHPTWNELLQYLKVPRKIELVESTAFDVLRSHEEQSMIFKELRNIMALCHFF